MNHSVGRCPSMMHNSVRTRRGPNMDPMRSRSRSDMDVPRCRSMMVDHTIRAR